MCSSVASALGFGVWKVNTKAPALMTVWSAARGAGRLSKRGHSFCLRSLAGPIQPPTPLQHPLPSPREKRGRASCLPRSLLAFCHQTESEPCYSTASDRTSSSACHLSAASGKHDYLDECKSNLSMLVKIKT